MGQQCEWKVHLQWTGQRVGFIRSWREFSARLLLRVDDTIVFTPQDDGVTSQNFQILECKDK
jgi:hypothetical protein